MAEHERTEEHGDKAAHASEGHGGGGHGGHGGGGHEEHEGAPEWLISFADNVVLLMGFFVILLAMNMPKPAQGGMGGETGNPLPNEDKMLDFVIGLRAAFNSPIDLTSSDPGEASLRRRIRERDAQIESDESSTGGDPAVDPSVRPQEYANLGGTIPFDDNTTALSPAGRRIAEEIAQSIRGIRFVVEIRGHASPSETFQDFNKGMNLAFGRARTVSEVLIAQGLKGEQLRLIASGDNDRRIPFSYDRGADAHNQRVEVVVTREAVPEDPFSKSDKPNTPQR